MRTWFAILFSLLVATAQPAALMANDITSEMASSTCGNCPACCQEQAPSETPPVPALPARSVSQDDWQFVFALVTHFSVSTAEAPQNITAPLVSTVRATSVPIFQRNCSYLI